MKKITLKIPLIHILSIILFYTLIKVSMETEIQGKNEFAELLYGMTFFMRHDIITLDSRGGLWVSDRRNRG